MKTREWCLTLNNPTEADYEVFTSNQSRFYYYLVGLETSPGGKKTPHFQCYIVFKSKVDFNSVKKLFPKAHIEPALRSEYENIRYCSKGGFFREYVSVGYAVERYYNFSEENVQ